MMRLWRLIKELIMKATRFILNTDYVTSQNDAEFTISVTIPSSFSAAVAEIKKFQTSKTVLGSASKDYRCYFTTSVDSYAVTGVMECMIDYGSDQLNCAVQRAKDKWTLCVYNLAYPTAKTYSGQARTITAHIQTFVDPFQV